MENLMQLKFRPAMLVFLAGLLLTSLAACGTDSTDNSEVVLPIIQTSDPNVSPTVSEICNNILYPTTQGATWVYTSTGGPSGTFTYTNSITEGRADGFTLTTKFADIARDQEWSCQPDGLKALQLGGGSAAGISIQGMTSDLTASEVTGIILPQNITSGMQWQYSLKLQGTIVMPGDPQAPASGVYSVTMQEMGVETVTVPAGTFEATKVQSNSTIDVISTFAGNEVPIKFNGTTITWYAPGVGYVKSVENGDFGGEAFSATTELQSYNIP
jgi:hypothetical protein